MKFFKVTAEPFGKKYTVASGYRFPDGTTVAIGNLDKTGCVVSTAEDFERGIKLLPASLKVEVEWFE